MLKCKEVAELSSDYLEKDLSLYKRFMFSVHLFLCGKCRKFIRHLKLSIALFDSMPEKSVSDEDAQRIARLAIGKSRQTE